MTDLPSAWGRYYDRIWCVDFEYHTGTTGADAPKPICMVAIDALSGQTIREWLWNRPLSRCPFSTDERSLFVAYYASAETTCFAALNWEFPKRVLDLQVEFRQLGNGLDRLRSDLEKAALKEYERHSLLACLYAFGCVDQAIGADVKDHMRQLCIDGGPYPPQTHRQIIDYCESDVRALVALLPKMAPHIDLPTALFRGRYMANVGRVERTGIPVDLDLVNRLKHHWGAVVDRLIDVNKSEFDVIGHRDIDAGKFEGWLLANRIYQWERTTHGRLSTSSNTLSDWAKYHPKVMQLKEFLEAVRRTKLFKDLAIGADGRNRVLLSPFGSKTGRNTPSNSRSVFGPACWVRSLVRPSPGHALLYCDWSGQEYGEAAYFSGDQRMIYDYTNDDPYLGFGKRIGLVPTFATKKSHKKIRDELKVAAGLGVLYGAQYKTVARAGGMTDSRAKMVLAEHKRLYPTFWEWRSKVVNTAILEGELRTPLGWRWTVPRNAKSPSISNFPMQAAGADMMRVALCLAVERGLEVCAPVHDAFLVHCPINQIEEVRRATVQAMTEASAAVLGGPTLKVGVDDPIIYPHHYSDPRGEKMWGQITQLLSEVESTPKSRIPI